MYNMHIQVLIISIVLVCADMRHCDLDLMGHREGYCTRIDLHGTLPRLKGNRPCMDWKLFLFNKGEVKILVKNT